MDILLIVDLEDYIMIKILTPLGKETILRKLGKGKTFDHNTLYFINEVKIFNNLAYLTSLRSYY